VRSDAGEFALRGKSDAPKRLIRDLPLLEGMADPEIDGHHALVLPQVRRKAPHAYRRLEV